MILTGVILNIILCIVWCCWNFLVALGNAYGNQRSHGGVDMASVFTVVIGVTVITCVAVWFIPEEAAFFVLWAPLVAILGWQLWFMLAERSSRAHQRMMAEEYRKKQAAEEAEEKRQRKLAKRTAEEIDDEKNDEGAVDDKAQEYADADKIVDALVAERAAGDVGETGDGAGEAADAGDAKPELDSSPESQNAEQSEQKTEEVDSEPAQAAPASAQEIDPERKADTLARLSLVSHEFIQAESELPPELMKAFLWHYPKRGAFLLVHLSPDYSWRSYCIGVVKDQQLTIRDSEDSEEVAKYRSFFNIAGQTIFDHYDVVFTGEQEVYLHKLPKPKG